MQPLQYQDITPANYRDIWTPKPYTGRIIALGDASHATSPQLGQGCTMALLDAYWLAKSLERSARCDSTDGLGTGLDNRLEYWWRNRHKQLAYVRYLSRWLTPLFQSDSKFCSLFRDKLMAPVGRLPVFEHWQLKTLASEVFLPVD